MYLSDFDLQQLDEQKLTALPAEQKDALLGKLLWDLRDARVIHAPETCACCGQALEPAGFIARTGLYVYYTVHAKRGQEAMDAAGILPHFLSSVWETNKLNGINPFDTLRLVFEGR